ncbi:MAG: putative zinc-binding protein [Acidobacteriaceae bacterium]
MNTNSTKVGIISCSGEALREGAISRLAARRVLELLRSDRTVTLCLPLFLAGNEGERNFARTHPTITVDGCEKQCAKWGTERHSGPVSVALVVPQVLGHAAGEGHCSTKALAEEDTEAVWTVAERIAAEVDTIFGAQPEQDMPDGAQPGSGSCSCSSPLPGGTIQLNGKKVRIDGLPLIFAQCAERGVSTDDTGAGLLDAVKVYHSIPSGEEAEYQRALLEAYQEFRSGATPVK